MGCSVSGRIEESFGGGSSPLPDDSERLLLVAAAEPVGDPGLDLAGGRAAWVGPEAAGRAVAAGLVDVGPRLRFRHPLVRTVVYRAAS